MTTSTATRTTSTRTSPKKTSRKTLTSRINDALSFLRSEGMTIENPDMVESYLKKNPGVIKHLYDAPKKIDQYFGTGGELTLRMFSDPDIEEEPDLCIEVATTLSVEKANQSFEDFYRKWIFPSEDLDLKKLNITLDFLAA